MKNKYLLTGLICITSFISGCATTSGAGGSSMTEGGICFLASALGGGGIGVAIEDDPAAAGIGLLVGGVVGYYFCDTLEEPVAQVAVGDSDGDGVNDNRDQCPASPRGSRVNASGCPLDTDGDGVTDNNDRCPATPRGVAVNSTGCELDGDGDGVVNRLDNCPDTPRGQAVDARGCHVIFSLVGVNFDTNSANLTPAATTRLNEGLQMLRSNSGINVRIEGHTDSRGAESYNMQLSERRAQAVLDYLARNGINRNRMTAVGRGESTPVASNDTAAGRAQNRRVDFVVR